ncbi:hypothetical protein LZ32DRAFT_454181 [Colletotrichum eremochloae]|nr:hypothetical protein LZ32DRAFT_454181 [Colletotrichum eremochloae]
MGGNSSSPYLGTFLGRPVIKHDTFPRSTAECGCGCPCILRARNPAKHEVCHPSHGFPLEYWKRLTCLLSSSPSAAQDTPATSPIDGWELGIFPCLVGLTQLVRHSRTARDLGHSIGWGLSDASGRMQLVTRFSHRATRDIWGRIRALNLVSSDSYPLFLRTRVRIIPGVPFGAASSFELDRAHQSRVAKPVDLCHAHMSPVGNDYHFISVTSSVSGF